MSTHSAATTDIRSMVSKLDTSCRKIVSDAADLAYRSTHAVLDVEHVLFIFCNANEPDEPLLRKLVAAGLDVAAVRKEMNQQFATFKKGDGLPPALSDRLVQALRDAWFEASLVSPPMAVNVEILLRAIVLNEALFARLCHDMPGLRGLSQVTRLSDKAEAKEAAWDGEKMHSNLAKYTVDLTARAAAGEIDPVIGRDNEISQVVEILLRRRQNNPILTGEAGVGKTSIVEGLAQRIFAGLVPEALKNVRICSLDMGLLRAGASMRGEIESRLKGIISEVAASEVPVILFIDEAHTIVAGAAGQGEQSDIANLIKPELARGTLRTIAATTWAEYKRFFEKDAALSRRFQTVRVAEPSVPASEDILQGLVPILQKHHGVYIMQSAVEAAVRLSSRYMQDRQLPDKAISVLDTACARAVAALTGPANQEVNLSQRTELLSGRLRALQREHDWTGAGEDEITSVQNELAQVKAQLESTSVGATEATNVVVTENTPSQVPAVRVASEDVASVIADWTGVPSQKMLSDQYSMVSELEKTLALRVVGQRDAVRIICDRVRAYTAKLEDPSRPIGVFMLAGPSGVGKTETAHALAEGFFGKGGITVINMSEYQEAHTVSKLKGAPPGYVGYGQGGVLTEAIRRRPYGLLLLDEVEKAHPDVLDLFLQVFDKGFMEDSEGIVVDFKNTLVILTSNAGTELLESIDTTVARSPEEQEAFLEKLQQALLEHFKPAFLGRTQVVPYYTLSKPELRCIVKMKLDAIRRRFEASYRANLIFDDAVLDSIVAHCASQAIGARWIDQYISENILSRLSTYVLDRLALGQAVTTASVVLSDGRIHIESGDISQAKVTTKPGSKAKSKSKAISKSEERAE